MSPSPAATSPGPTTIPIYDSPAVLDRFTLEIDPSPLARTVIVERIDDGNGGRLTRVLPYDDGSRLAAARHGS